MPPKKATGTTAAATATTKKASAPADHPSYKDMIKDAILQLKERNGSSRQALKKYVLSNNKGIKESNFDTQFNAAIKRGVASGDFIQPKGPSGPVKLQKKDATKSTTKAAKVTGDKPAKPTVKKASTTKKAAVPKTAKSRAAAKPKTAAANSKKPRKTTAASTTEKSTAALSKTKTGRVSKASKPAAAAAAKKAAAPKKAAPKKKAAEAAAPAAE